MLKLEDVLKESYKLNKIKGWKQKEYASQKKESKIQIIYEVFKNDQHQIFSPPSNYLLK